MELKAGDIIMEYSTEVYATGASGRDRPLHVPFTATWLVTERYYWDCSSSENNTVGYKLYLLETSHQEGRFKPGYVDEIDNHDLNENKSVKWSKL